ncbi:hypothetical protein PHYSODRAFT_310799 [Phytophthora sojae]|uniref:Uncharacterized protein n=1 Tax=Phytophthora sojae (strain P6497) TaxID=1094619 RepID=G4YSK0_PHYSP|nr:hypothetical protein PHYSODRAFT_310799 [Phytophthora sojae]EGZ23493.1 hypothetical protein PHYSODRAFT_310799 [Phytophthora sojae]|eukprot:XP_009518781.1 hypothetical protein PHYSODRAFT_310799 [Phytophthora sojae]
MVCVQTLLKVLAFCALNVSLLPRAQANIVLVLPDDPACRSTPDMVYAGVMAITDPACLDSNEDPGCNLFGIPDCRACALLPEAASPDTPPCELLVVFNQESIDNAFGDEPPVSTEDCSDCEPDVPPPLVPSNPVDPIEPVETPDESSEPEDYVPIVIVLPTDVFIETESSIWADSDSSADYDDDSDGGGEQGGIDTGRRLRTQL